MMLQCCGEPSGGPEAEPALGLTAAGLHGAGYRAALLAKDPSNNQVVIRELTMCLALFCVFYVLTHESLITSI